MSLLIIPVYAGKPDPKPKKPPTHEHHVILGDPINGPIYWEDDTSSNVNKKIGAGIRVYFRNKDPSSEEFDVSFIGDWPSPLNGGKPGDPITVTGSDHLVVSIWWERAQQIEPARLGLTFYDDNDVEWLLKAEGFEIDKVVVDKVYTYTITLSGFSIAKIGDPSPPYDYETYGPLYVTLSIISDS